MSTTSKSAAGPVRDLERAHQVPLEWRPLLAKIVQEIANGTYDFDFQGETVTCPRQAKKRVQEYLASYSRKLTALPEETWKTSIAQWVDGFWDVLVDLWADSRKSDLVLFVRVFEARGGKYRFEIDSVHVP